MMLYLLEVKLWWDGPPHHHKLLSNILAQQRELTRCEIHQELAIRGLNSEAIQMNDKLFAKFGIELE